jgi:hypothetical protein
MAVNGFTNIVTDGLVLNLDAGNLKSYPTSGTTWVDLSKNGNTSTLTSTTFVSPYSGGINFNGTSSFANSNFVNPFAETVMVWVKSNTTTWNDFGWISASRRQNGHLIHPNTNFYGGDPKSVSFYVYDSSANVLGYSSISVSDITIPHLYCYSTNGSNRHKAYLDGVLYTTDTTVITRTSSPTAQNWYLGRDDFGSRFGNGVIYSVIRYNRALTDSEVLQNYNATKWRFI